MSENQTIERRAKKRPVTVWLPEDVIKKLDAKAEKIGLDRSEYIRMKLMSMLQEGEE